MAQTKNATSKKRVRRAVTPTILQMEAVECGAASLAIILGYYGRQVPLEELRVACGVSRDGSKASNILKAARNYGLVAKGFRWELPELHNANFPVIIFWNFNHFLVVEGFDHKNAIVYLSDPACGPRKVTFEEFNTAFTGVVLTLTPGSGFKKSEFKRSLLNSLKPRLKGAGNALTYVILASLALVVPGLIIPTFSKVFVDEFLIRQMDDWVKPLLLGMGFTALLRAALTWLQQAYLLRLETHLSLTSSCSFFWHVLRLPMEFFGQRFAGDIAQRITSNDEVARLLSGDLATNVINLFTLVFYAALMLQYDLGLTAVAVSIAALNLLALKYVSRVRKDGNLKMLQEEGKLIATTMGGFQTIETLKATGGESDFFMRWSGYKAKVVNAEQEIGIYTQCLSVVPPLLSALGTAVILGLGGLRMIEGDLTVGSLVAFQSLMASFMIPVTMLVGVSSKLQEAEGTLARLDDVLNYPIEPLFEIQEKLDEKQTARFATGEKLSGHLELKNITFGYSKLESPLIEDFSLVLKPGTRVALIGGSGSGKSTVAKLVSGINKPWSGEILFDGLPREQIPRAVLAGSLAMVDQDIVVFGASVRENIALWDETVPEQDIIQAAKDACIHDLITGRPHGFDAMVKEGGGNFSGGERQRIEIARALAVNPTLLVLDEATAALDPLVEKQIDDRLRQRGCACLIVAHRLSTIRDCDEIIVMEYGKVVQRGTHHGMLAEDGPYAHLIKAE